MDLQDAHLGSQTEDLEPFERWAVTGEADGVAGEFELSGSTTDGTSA